MQQPAIKAAEEAETRDRTRLRAWVAKRCSPRGAMTLILAGTTGAGSVASYLLLHAGVTHFGIRYALSILTAYSVLLALIHLWSRYEMRRIGGGGKRGSVDFGDALNLADTGGGGSSFSTGSGGGGGLRFGGGGGRFGGGGASAAFDSPP